MKILVSDYDGTLNYGTLITNSNISTIKRFMELGNKFGIATTNNFSSMRSELKKYNFRPDYLSVSNGLALFDRNNNLEDAKIIDKTVKSEILYLLCPFVSKKIITKDPYDNYSNENIVDIIGFSKDLRCLKNIYEYMSMYFPDYAFINRALEIHIRKKSNKVDSVDKIREIEKVDDSNIYTIGNDLSDLEMIKKYNGYTTPFSNPKVTKESIATVSSVKKLIKTMKY